MSKRPKKQYNQPSIKKRKRKEPDAYHSLRKEHRGKTTRHVIGLKPILTEEKRRKLESLEQKHVYVYRTLKSEARKCVHDLMECKQYRKAKCEYGKIIAHRNEDGNLPPKYEKQRFEVKQTLEEWQQHFGVDKTRFRKLAEFQAKRQSLPSVIALSDMEMVWQGVEEVLYGNGEKIGSQDYAYTRPIIRAKQINRILPLKVDKQQRLLFVMLDGERFYLEKPTPHHDAWLFYEYEGIVSYLLESNPEDKFLMAYEETGVPQDTHRPCYVQLFSEKYRGQWHYEFQIIIEGHPYQKIDENGVLRHDFPMDGEVAMDLGTQSYAAYAPDDSFVKLANLGERNHKSTFENERKQARIQRAMDRSRRTMNPEYYNSNGTIKKGKKEWKKSNRYMKNHSRLHDLYRKNRINRRLGNAEAANELRSHGAFLVTENVSVAAWARKAKNGKVVDEDGVEHYRRRKRHGRSIQNRCPGQFNQVLKEKFDGTRYVALMYRASQYDHVRDEYHKKGLGERVHKLPDGIEVQRDMYSCFLMACHDEDYEVIDRDKCLANFEAFYVLARDYIEAMVASGYQVMNSGY